MSFFAMIFLFFVFVRLAACRRPHFSRLHESGSHRFKQCRMRSIEVTEPPRPSVYEQLKQRYVRGDIDVDEYERQLDEILRSPEGRRAVN